MGMMTDRRFNNANANKEGNMATTRKAVPHHLMHHGLTFCEMPFTTYQEMGSPVCEYSSRTKARAAAKAACLAKYGCESHHAVRVVRGPCPTADKEGV